MNLTIEEYYNDLLQEIYIASDVERDFKESQFFEKSIEYLIEDGTVQDYNYTPFKKTGLKIDGYELIEDRGILNLFICEFVDSETLENLVTTEINSITKRATNFIEKSIEDNTFYKQLEESSPGYSAAYFFFTNRSRIEHINIILITNKVLAKSVKNVKIPNLGSYTMSYDIWDVKRFYDIETSKTKKEALLINFEDEFGEGLPVLPAHISKSPYKSYLCVLNGEILASLYEKYGARLLEANVRSFLQLRGNVNKGIKKTIIEEPEMFFAYNNGLTATAEAILVENNKIIELTNFQIVNGGQTTASLYNTKKANPNENISLEDIFVQMKLTVIDDNKANEVIPNISRFANTQNKVQDADFFSNDIFHIRIEEKSRRIWAPKKQGELKQTKWFYERARGQYDESRNSSKNRKEFTEIFPTQQKITKTDLAKYMMVWENCPQIVSRGGQKNFQAFAGLIVPRWNKNDEEFNDLYFQHLVAKILIYKAADKIVFKQDWYGGYKINIVVYTLSAISYMLSKEKLSVDFDKVWKLQDITPIFEKEIIRISEYIHYFIFKTPDGMSNISEYCKRDICWTKLKDIINHTNDLYLSEEFKNEMMENTDVEYQAKEAKKVQQIDNIKEVMDKLYKLTSADWKEIMSWGQEHNLLIDSELQLLNLIPSAKYPSDFQMKKIVKIIQKLETEGMKTFL